MSITIETAQVALQLDLSRFNRQFELVRKKLLSLNKIIVAPTLTPKGTGAGKGATASAARDAALLSGALGGAALNADKVAKAVSKIDISKFIDNRFQKSITSAIPAVNKFVSAYNSLGKNIISNTQLFKASWKTFGIGVKKAMAGTWGFTDTFRKLRTTGGTAITSTAALLKQGLIGGFTKLGAIGTGVMNKLAIGMFKLGATIKASLLPLLKVLAPLAIIGGLIKGIGEQRVDDKAFRSLSTTLAKTGTQIGRTEQQVRNLINELDSTTGVAKDQLANAFSILATFVNITGDTFDRTAKAAVDMAQVMGTDVKAAALQLGKALNDPIKGVTALTRVGVSFTQQEREKIKALVEVNDTLQAQKFILDAIEKQGIGGQAQAAADGWDQVKKSFADILKVSGSLLSDILGLTGEAGGFANGLRAVEAALQRIRASDFWKTFTIQSKSLTRQLGVIVSYLSQAVWPVLKVIIAGTLQGIQLIITGLITAVRLSVSLFAKLEGAADRFWGNVFGVGPQGDQGIGGFFRRFNKDLENAADFDKISKEFEKQFGVIPVVLDADDVDVDIPVDDMKDFNEEVKKMVSILGRASGIWETFQQNISDSVKDVKNIGKNLGGPSGKIQLTQDRTQESSIGNAIKQLIQVNRTGFENVTNAVNNQRPAFIF